MVTPGIYIGERAKTFIDSVPRWEVLGRTSQAVYLFAGGEVLWVSGPKGELHCRAILAERLPRWVAGSTAIVEGQELCGGEERLSLREAKLWRSPSLPRPTANVRFLTRKLLENFSSSFPSVRAVLGNRWWDACCYALSHANAAGFLILARDKVGLGPGLTPLADDFLGGALFALQALVPEPTWSREVADFLAWAEARTPRLSFCLLSDLSQGQGPAALHALAKAILSGEENRVWGNARDVVKLGRSTGAALLLGALLVWAEFGERSKRWRI